MSPLRTTFCKFKCSFEVSVFALLLQVNLDTEKDFKFFNFKFFFTHTGYIQTPHYNLSSFIGMIKRLCISKALTAHRTNGVAQSVIDSALIQ